MNSENKKSSIIFVLTIVTPLLIISIGTIGSYTMMYSQTGIIIEHHTVFSEHYGNPMALNYFKPNDGQKTDVGIIVAHGFSSDRWGLHNLGLSLAQTGIHVAAMDYRGHGDTEGDLATARAVSGERSQENLDTAANDMLTAWKFLTGIGCKYIATVGHSMGGFTSIRFAMKYTELVNASVLLGSTMPFIGDDLNETKPHNLLFIIGAQEELFSQESLLYSLQTTTGNTMAQLDTLYGDFNSGTARKAMIISSPGKYLGHVDEPINPLFFIPTLDWLNESLSAFGGKINYSADYRGQIVDFYTTITNLQNLILIGIFLLFIPIIVGFSIKLKNKNHTELQCEKAPQGLSSDEIKLDHNGITQRDLILFLFLTSFMGVLGITLTKSLGIVWFPIASTAYFIGGLVFQIIGGAIFLGLKLAGKSLDFKQFRFNKSMTVTNLIFGVSLGLIFPVSLQVFTISFNIPNILGGLPSKPVMYGFWVLLALLILISQLMIEIMLQEYQKYAIKDSEHQRPLRIFLKISGGMLLYYLIIIAGLVTVGISTLTLSFTAGFFAAIAFVPLLGAIVFRYLKSNIPTILFTAIILSGVIVNLLPYSSLG